MEELVDLELGRVTVLFGETQGQYPQGTTLVVRGAASDVLSPDCADRMVDEALAEGTLAVVPQSAHAVMVENPQGFNRAVADFVLGEG